MWRGRRVCRNTLWMSRAWLCFLLVVLIEPRALHSLGKCSATDLHPLLSGNESFGVSDVSVGTSETARNHFVCFWVMSTE